MLEILKDLTIEFLSARIEIETDRISIEFIIMQINTNHDKLLIFTEEKIKKKKKHTKFIYFY